MAENYNLNVKANYNDKNLNQGLRKTENSFGRLEKSMTAGAKALGAFFAVDQIKNFTSEVIKTRVEFERLETVLGVTLGSQSEAARAFKQIQDFAAVTPFSVLQLSDSFVKLTNFGLRPSMKEMRSYGDLASSTGKSFDQLAEAIIDATTGEFERLKEFGIRSSKMGDKVKFTFKGVETQTKFTSSSIKDYIVSLGNAQGVSGAMEAQSKTLGGQLSNLGDKFDSLKNQLGKELTPTANSFLTVLGKITDKLTKISKKGVVGFATEGLFSEEVMEQAKFLMSFLDRSDINQTARELLSIITDLEKQLDQTSKKTPQFGKLQSVIELLKIEYNKLADAISNANQKQKTLTKTFKDAQTKALNDRIAALRANQKKLQSKPKATPGIPGLPGGKTTGDLGDPAKRAQEILDSINVIKDKTEFAIFEFAEVFDFGPAISNALTDSLSTIASAFGSGEKITKIMGKLLGVIAENLQGMGTALIASGTALSALASLNPGVQIAAGIAAVAAGAAVKRIASKNAAAVGGGGARVSRGAGAKKGGSGTFISQGQATEIRGGGGSVSEPVEKVVSDFFTLVKSDVDFNTLYNLNKVDKTTPDFVNLNAVDTTFSKLYNMEPETVDPMISLAQKSFKFTDFAKFQGQTIDTSQFLNVKTIQLPKLEFKGVGITGGTGAKNELFVKVDLNPTDLRLRGTDLVGALTLAQRNLDRFGTGGNPNIGTGGPGGTGGGTGSTGGGFIKIGLGGGKFFNGRG